jgi:hypothetical protein
LQAVRAIRHPERYGPRAGDPNVFGPEGEPQTRAAGLTRAILDTFPVVKFYRSTAPREPNYHNSSPKGEGSLKSSKGGAYNADTANEIEMGTREPGMVHLSAPAAVRHDSTGSIKPAVLSNVPAVDEGSRKFQEVSLPSAPVASTSGHLSAADTPSNGYQVTPDSIGYATCPICILDFEEGDDIRVLPCDGKHTFHKDCVDPWLLELSSSCPLCREGGSTL